MTKSQHQRQKAGATAAAPAGGGHKKNQQGRIPHKGKKSSGKRKLNFDRAGGNKNKYNKFGARKEENAAAPRPFMMDGEVVPKLDQSDPVQARRIQQRRRMIMFGKNTAGYDEYCKQVPKEKRKPRSIDHPTTPDHTLDIPNRRWQGMVKAWRRALHKFDPPDLQNADVHKPQDPLVAAMSSTFAAAAVMGKPGEGESQNNRGGVQAKQIADAASSGMLVDFGGGVAGGSGDDTLQEQEEAKYQEMIQHAEEENRDNLVAFGDNTAGALLDDDDSDDDLL